MAYGHKKALPVSHSEMDAVIDSFLNISCVSGGTMRSSSHTSY